MTDFTLMPHLPEDIIIEILSRLPPISLLKFRRFVAQKTSTMITLVLADMMVLSLWNPSTGDCKVIPSPPDDQIKGYNSVLDLSTLRGYGSGYDSKSDDYKFVCFTRYFKLNQSNVKIYSLRSDSCKRFKKTQKTSWILSSKSLKYGVFCNGALHWQSSSLSGALIALHLTDAEVLKEISQPKTNFEKSGDTTFIGVLDGCLSMLYSNVNVNHGCEYG
ncbi:F-box protein CPR1-like [Papaver somniferum]|uniref:F-box protein CPR1-like n=1 Tax=Papaver somniferum TaxID=3469 RepID=UPI000E6FDC48|nr:F-box protein CPR1-like [Papaver somniferum]